jgi:hypothetical protein
MAKRNEMLPPRRCERSEAIQKCACGGSLDCFVASPLAMTEVAVVPSASEPVAEIELE